MRKKTTKKKTKRKVTEESESDNESYDISDEEEASPKKS